MNTAANTTSIDSQRKNQRQELIAANVKSLIEQFEAGHSDALTAYLDAMSRFHNYSFGNILEIARQRPDATRVAGLWSWKQLGRKVKKGEKGTRRVCVARESATLFASSPGKADIPTSHGAASGFTNRRSAVHGP